MVCGVSTGNLLPSADKANEGKGREGSNRPIKETARGWTRLDWTDKCCKGSPAGWVGKGRLPCKKEDGMEGQHRTDRH